MDTFVSPPFFSVLSDNYLGDNFYQALLSQTQDVLPQAFIIDKIRWDAVRTTSLCDL